MALTVSGGVGELCVAGSGLVASVGFGVDAVSAAVRARLAWLREEPGATGPGSRPVLSLVPGVTGTGVARLAQLCAPAVVEALSPLRAGAPSRVHLLLGGAAPGTAAERAGPLDLAAHIAALAPEVTWIHHEPDPRGHASALLTLARVRQLAAEDPEALFLVGGVCSHRDPETLARLDAQGRLLSDENPDGFVPGEAAAFCLVAGPRAARLAGLRPLASLGPVGSAVEDVTGAPERIPLGRALAAAVRAALPPGSPPIGSVWCDLNGESRRSDDWAGAYLLVAPAMGRRPALWHPADRWGDIGAASGPALICLAARELRRTGAGSALIVTSSDSGERAAVAVHSIAAA